MSKLNEGEFKAIQKSLKQYSPKQTAYMMKRSLACILRIKGSKNFTEYKELVKSEHTAKRPRIPLWRQVRDARIEELNALLDHKMIRRRVIIQRILDLRSA